jgi:limonene-1,2-epoxide hydrolase
MKTVKNIIQQYCRALQTNDYHAMIGLFSQDAKVISYFTGEKPAAEFFCNLFKTSRRTTVELKNLFIDGNATIAAYVHLEAIWNEKSVIQFEAVDIFEVNSENKITTLRIILDTYPLRKLQAELVRAI